MRVLVVEDEAVLADAVARGCAGRAWPSTSPLDGEVALERVAVNRYDVVVLDRDLPVVHGDEVCRRLTGAATGRAAPRCSC